jgi:hypothetical protein
MTWYNKITMATGNTDDGLFNLPFPKASDPVNVHTDIHDLVRRLLVILPPLGLSQFQLGVLNNSGEFLPAGTPVYATGYNNKTTIAKALPTTTKPILGLTKTSIASGSDGIVVVAGVLENINLSSGYSAGDVLYVGSSGGLSNTPNGGAVGIVAHADENGVIIVEAKGNGTWGALKAGLA